MLLNNKWITEEIKWERKHDDPNLWNTAKEVLRKVYYNKTLP